VPICCAASRFTGTTSAFQMRATALRTMPQARPAATRSSAPFWRSAVNRANRYLFFDALGNPTPVSVVAAGAMTFPVTVAQGGTGATAAPAALDNLLAGTSRRIAADFSSATLATRTYIQTSTVNATTSLGLLPNGTGTASLFSASALADPTNAPVVNVGINATEAFMSASRNGSGAYRPLHLLTSDIRRFEIDVNGNIVVGTGAALAGLRIATIGNSNAAANSGSAWSTNSNAGSTSIVAWSAATGSSGFGAVQTDMPGGLSLVSLSATGTLNFLTNNINRLTVRADGSIWTDANTRPSFRCRAWVQFNGATGAMAGSGNVSSVTRNSLGNYTVNFTVAQPDTAYSVSATVNAQSGGGSLVAPYVTPPSSTANFQIQCLQDSGASPADTITHVAVFR
jgi:hypothetical protein